MLLPLLWKDLRLNKYMILLAVFLVDTPFVTTALGLSAFTGEPEDNTPLTERLTIAFPFSLFFLAIASAFIGGSPVTAEKSERTDRFLAYLPPTRWAVVTSKLLIALGLFVLAWAGPAFVYFYFLRSVAVEGLVGAGVKLIVYHCITASLMLFGLSWLVSMYVRSSTLCGLAAIVGWIVVLTIVRKTWFVLHGRPGMAHMIDYLPWIGGAIAVLSLAAGIVLFLRAPAD
ncbi:MAG TPA: hypothetical protein VHY91_22620 [Pirellulales bacterium]|jgi:ABC-type transport system involved in multi-copper enzyme maturation permease subunit|nr:hypothetical protein [Pirellulales bacterium]